MCLYDKCPVAVTCIIMKCFKRLVMTHINSSLPACLDPLQFAYQCNRSTVDAIPLALHTFLEQLGSNDTSVTPLLIDYSAFNTKISSRLISKVWDRGFSSSTLEPPKDASVPLLYSLYTNDHVAKFRTNTAYKFVDDTTMLERIANNDESECRKEMEGLEIWYVHNETHQLSIAIENILSRCITAWYDNCSAQYRKKLQEVVCTGQTITEATLPS
eukprot:g43080.t1